MLQPRIGNDRAKERNASVERKNVINAQTMIGNNHATFDPFSQLSLDHNFEPGDDSNPTAPAPATPPPPVPTKSENSSMMGGGMILSGATKNAVGQHNKCQLPYKHQPMQVTPDQEVAHQQGPQQRPHLECYANIRLDAFDHQHHHVTLYPPPATNNFTMAAANSFTSPPISPLWNSASPITSPMGGAANNVANNFVDTMPSLPYAAPLPTLGEIGLAQNPFDLFDGAPAAPAADSAPVYPFADDNALLPMQKQHRASEHQQDNADFWNDMGFGLPTPPISNDRDGDRDNLTHAGDSDGSHYGNSSEDDASDASPTYRRDHSHNEAPVALDGRGLPAGGEYYNARVTTPLLGAIFSSGHELRSTLLKTASDSFVEAIGDRPVISFIIDGSAADTAGIQLGHVLLNVNGEDVTNTDEAVRMISAAPRPMTMEYYIPNKEVRLVKTEAQCMVKYDDQSTDAPQYAGAWKPKYVVVGDILGKPHILYMYRSKVGMALHVIM
jgi:hypothetical protein